MSKRYEALLKTIEDTNSIKYNIPYVFNELNKDTRTIKTSDVYVAIKGEQFDGHNFIDKAIELGASFIISSEKLDDSTPHVYCKNTLQFLQVWAKNYRHLHDAIFIGITGSNGKTTTKELIYTVLKGKYKTYRTPGNYNNNIGVPLTLLNMPENSEYGIIEMGTNHVGEIPFLAKLIEPDHSIVLNIGFSHMANFESVSVLAEEKCSLYTHTKKNGICFTNSDDPMISISDLHKTISFSTDFESDFKMSYIKFKDGKMIAECNKLKLNLTILGKHLLTNVAVAYAIGKTFSVSDDIIKTQLESFKPVSGRMEWIDKGDTCFIHDAYNANPNSMQAALNFLSETDFGCKKIAILGDMLELGHSSKEKHDKILCVSKPMDIDEILLFGEEFKSVNMGLRYFESHSDINTYLDQISEKKVVLLKGSRGMKLEKIILL